MWEYFPSCPGGTCIGFCPHSKKKVFLPYSGNAEHEANSCNPLWSFIVYLAEGLGLPQVYVVYDTFCCLGAMGHFVAGNQGPDADLVLVKIRGSSVEVGEA